MCFGASKLFFIWAQDMSIYVEFSLNLSCAKSSFTHHAVFCQIGGAIPFLLVFSTAAAALEKDIYMILFFIFCLGNKNFMKKNLK